MIWPSKSYGDTDFITGLRALAALGVVLIHAGGAGLRELGAVGSTLVDLGRSGVYVFFIISGFSVAQSFSQSSGYLEYLNKRLWRIVPLYYFWIFSSIFLSVTAVFWQEKFGVEVDLYNVLMHLSFLSVFDYKITNTILGVEWSISIEVFWYFFVPGLLLLSKRKIVLGLMVIVSALIVLMAKKYFSRLPIAADDVSLALYWSPIPFLFSFCLGIAAYRLREGGLKSRFSGNPVFLVGLFSILVYLIAPGKVLHVFKSDFLFMSLVTFLVVSFGTVESRLFKVFLANRLILGVGAVSYGLYLSHVPVLTLMGNAFPEFFANHKAAAFGVVVLVSIAISLATYHVIEQPSARLGSRLLRRRFEAKSKSAQGLSVR